MGTSYTYGSLEAALFVKAGTYVKAATYVQAGTQLIAGTTVKAAGGLQVKEYVFKCPTAAGSVAVVGIAATDFLQSAYAVKLTQAATLPCIVKTCGTMTTAITLGTAKVIVANVKGFSNAAVHVLTHTPA
jgi:hypothetical protein